MLFSWQIPIVFKYSLLTLFISHFFLRLLCLKQAGIKIDFVWFTTGADTLFHSIPAPIFDTSVLFHRTGFLGDPEKLTKNITAVLFSSSTLTSSTSPKKNSIIRLSKNSTNTSAFSILQNTLAYLKPKLFFSSENYHDLNIKSRLRATKIHIPEIHI